MILTSSALSFDNFLNNGGSYSIFQIPQPSKMTTLRRRQGWRFQFSVQDRSELGRMVEADTPHWGSASRPLRSRRPRGLLSSFSLFKHQECWVLLVIMEVRLCNGCWVTITTKLVILKKSVIYVFTEPNLPRSSPPSFPQRPKSRKKSTVQCEFVMKKTCEYSSPIC